MGNYLKEACLPECKAGDQPGHSSLPRKGNTDRKQRYIFQRKSAICKSLSGSNYCPYGYSWGGWSQTVLPRASQFTGSRYCTYIYHFKMS